MKKVTISTGGHPRSNNDLRHMQEGYMQALKALALAFSRGVETKLILSGFSIALTGTFPLYTAALTAGFFFWEDEIYFFPGITGLAWDFSGDQLWFTKVTTYPPNNPALYADGINKNIHATVELGVYTAASASSPSDVALTSFSSPSASIATLIGFDINQILNSGNANYFLHLYGIEAWKEVGASGQPAFSSNWANDGLGANKAAFKKDAVNNVHLKGQVIAIASGTTVVFTLPVGYRPLQYRLFLAYQYHPSTLEHISFAKVTITNNGDVAINSEIGIGAGLVDLSSIHFVAEQ